MSRTTRMVAVAGLAVAAAVAILILMLVLAGSGDVQVRLGRDEFRAGRTDAMADAIARDGPIAFGDLLGGERPLYLQHLGSDPDEGWLALAAIAPGQPVDCVLEWSAARAVFVDPCGGTTYPPDGAGLVRYRTRVDDQFVYVDLRVGDTSSTTP